MYVDLAITVRSSEIISRPIHTYIEWIRNGSVDGRFADISIADDRSNDAAMCF
jgi:hypothetical protein